MLRLELAVATVAVCVVVAEVIESAIISFVDFTAADLGWEEGSCSWGLIRKWDQTSLGLEEELAIVK